MTAPEYRTQVKRWFVEIGVSDGNGMGYWIDTEESVKVTGEAEANALRDDWLASGKLREMPWGELRPQNPYGLFRVRQAWEDLPAPTDAAQAPAEDAHVKGETAGQMLERLGMDGAKWAAEFRTTALRLGYSDMDEGWLVGWFCNAIMAGHDRSAAQAREAALMEAHKAILAMDTKKDEDLNYNLAVLRAAEKVRRLIGEART